ncbi:Hypothetical_protein [Hexamita inflata]|uniref:Hypothetical_protein n=1 Tax=Hexamita inflata TaxID=28002 RepID=A0AA86UY17_9EUKA|nr:Hypothetical protein HINF_LOCUS60194 [Hexamita inflata]
MQASIIVQKHPPKDNQIFEGIPLDQVIGISYSNKRKRIHSYLTDSGRYFLGTVKGDESQPVIFCCVPRTKINQFNDDRIRPVRFISKAGVETVITKTDYEHVPYSVVYDTNGFVRAEYIEQEKLMKSLQKKQMPEQTLVKSFLCKDAFGEAQKVDKLEPGFVPPAPFFKKEGDVLEVATVVVQPAPVKFQNGFVPPEPFFK